jgi:hypothetical protein
LLAKGALAAAGGRPYLPRKARCAVYAHRCWAPRRRGAPRSRRRDELYGLTPNCWAHRMTGPPPDAGRLKAALGPGRLVGRSGAIAPKLVEWRGRWRGETPILLLPRTPQEVAAAVRICAETGTAVTPQGGGTGLVGGQIRRARCCSPPSACGRSARSPPATTRSWSRPGVTLAEVQAAAAGRTATSR